MEPYWNVNDDQRQDVLYYSCINGTILECKQRNRKKEEHTKERINGTILECKRLFSSPNRAR